MLTPQDIQNKEFTKAVFGGYDMSVVDDFLEEITGDYAALYKENAILKSKIKVLVEKVEEYRSTEDAMRMALLTAQKMGDELLAEAKQKSENIVSEADAAAQNKLREIADGIALEESRLHAAKEQTQTFIRQSGALLAEQQQFLDKLSALIPADTEPVKVRPAPSAPAKDKEAEILDTAEQIAGAVSKMTDSVPTPPAQTAVHNDEGEPTKVIGKPGWEDDDEPISPRPKFDFNDLKFGSNYSDGSSSK